MSGDSVNSYAKFMPQIIIVKGGEDISMKVMSLSLQGHKAICIFSGTGQISKATLHSPDFSGGTLTYEGRFEILSLSGSLMPIDNEGESRSGGMTITLLSPDGRVIGGAVANGLIAASPVQVVVGTFPQRSKKPKKPESDYTASSGSVSSSYADNIDD